jgi:hypothetical protein
MSAPVAALRSAGEPRVDAGPSAAAMVGAGCEADERRVDAGPTSVPATGAGGQADVRRMDSRAVSAVPLGAGSKADVRGIDSRPTSPVTLGARSEAGERRIDSCPASATTLGAVSEADERRIDSCPASATTLGAVSEADERRIDSCPASATTLGARGPADERRIDSSAAALAVRRSARTLHAACAELLPGYAGATREPWRQALLTAGCLDARRWRVVARWPAPPLVVEDVVQPSDVLCALWLARRCGLFSPGSACGDAVGRRSECDIVPAFAPGVCEAGRDAVWEALRGNTAWQAHRAARAVAS